MSILKKLFNIGTNDETNIPQNYDTNSTEFYMEIEDVFTIMGRGTVVTGRISKGMIKIGDNVFINGGIQATVTGVEMFRKTLDMATEGDNVGLLLSNVGRNEVKKGDILTKK